MPSDSRATIPTSAQFCVSLLLRVYYCSSADDPSAGNRESIYSLRTLFAEKWSDVLQSIHPDSRTIEFHVSAHFLTTLSLSLHLSAVPVGQELAIYNIIERTHPRSQPFLTSLTRHEKSGSSNAFGWMTDHKPVFNRHVMNKLPEMAHYRNLDAQTDLVGTWQANP